MLAGSTAAGIQSGIGIVTAGSWFATFQSFGALGLWILGTAALPVTLGAGLTVGGYYLYKNIKHYQPKPKLWSYSS